MREIKFRAWNGLNILHDFLVARPQFADPLKIMTDADFAKSQYGLNEWVVMQYTGLKDKNGIEIYEGDIIDISNGETFIVYWDSHYDFCFKKSDDNKGYHKTYRGATRDEGWIVIGNIYQNANLLK